MRTFRKVEGTSVEFEMHVSLSPACGDGRDNGHQPHEDHGLWTLLAPATTPKNLQIVAVQSDGKFLPLPVNVTHEDGSALFVAVSGKHKQPGEYVTFRVIDGPTLLLEHHTPPLPVLLGQTLTVRLGLQLLIRNPIPVKGGAGGNTGSKVTVEAKEPEQIETE